jgi:PhnB protein
MAVKPIPEGQHSVTPYLVVDGAAKLIDFLKQAFAGKEEHRSVRPDGSVMHAQVRIGDSVVMLSDATAQFRPTTAMVHLYLEDADAAYKRAIQAGATSLMEPANQFYGDRSGGVLDPFGIKWWVATHIEDVTPEEMAKREEALVK